MTLIAVVVLGLALAIMDNLVAVAEVVLCSLDP
jgi:hypothetical protein